MENIPQQPEQEVLDNSTFSINTWFNNLPIRIIGSPVEPFFYASDILAVLGLKNITASIKNFNHTELATPEMRAHHNLVTYKKYRGDMRRDDSVKLLTENGVRRLLSNSRTPNAERMRSLLDDKKYYYNSIPEMNFVDKIQKTFSGDKIELQKQILGYRVDLYFTDYNIAVEFDESHHNYQTIADAHRQNVIENELKCIFIRAKQTDDIFEIMGKIYALIKGK